MKTVTRKRRDLIMKKRSNFFVILSIILLAFLVLMACTPDDELDVTDEPDVTDEITDEPEDVDEPEDTDDPEEANDAAEGELEGELNIAIFEGGFGRDFWYDLVERFEAVHQGVTVNMDLSPDIIELIAPQIAVGEFPDLISANMDEGVLAAMQAGREFISLNDFFASTEVLDRPGTMINELILPGMLESSHFMNYDGNIYFAPFNVGPMGMVYNQTLFDEMGWDIPETWDELFALDDLLDDPDTFVEVDGSMERRAIFTYQGIHPGYLESIVFPAIASSAGIDVLTAISNFEEDAWDNPQVHEVIENLARLGLEDYLMEGTVALNHTVTQADMMMGRALFIPNGLWMVGEMEDAPVEDGMVFAMAPAPALEHGSNRYVMSSSERFGIPTNAENPELALEFLQFIYTEDTMRAFTQLAGGTLATYNAIDVAGQYLELDVANMIDSVFSRHDGTVLIYSWGTFPEGLPHTPNDSMFDENMTPLMTGTITLDEYIQRQMDFAEEVRDRSD